MATRTSLVECVRRPQPRAAERRRQTRRRPLSTTLDPALDAGFRLGAISEPQPTEAFAEKRPEASETEMETPCFVSPSRTCGLRTTRR